MGALIALSYPCSRLNEMRHKGTGVTWHYTLYPTPKATAMKMHEWLDTCHTPLPRLSYRRGSQLSVPERKVMRADIGAWLRGGAAEGYWGLQRFEERTMEICSTSTSVLQWICTLMQWDFSWVELVYLLEEITNNHHSFGGYTLDIEVVAPLTL